MGVICGPILLVSGFIMRKWPPKKVNWLYGYRTAASMQSQERWNFAQQYSARQMIKCGAILLSAALLMAFFAAPIEVITIASLALLVLCCIYLLVTTERAIKNQFKN